MAVYENSNDYATRGQGTATTVLSAITTGLLALNGNGGFGGFFGGNNNISAMAIAQKDAEIAMLKADNDTDRKLVEVYNALFKNDKEQNAKIEAIHTNLAILNTQMAQVMGLTALHIPATNVCPLPMPRYNQWSVDPLAASASVASADPSAKA